MKWSAHKIFRSLHDYFSSISMMEVKTNKERPKISWHRERKKFIFGIKIVVSPRSIGEPVVREVVAELESLLNQATTLDQQVTIINVLNVHKAMYFPVSTYVSIPTQIFLYECMYLYQLLFVYQTFLYKRAFLYQRMVIYQITFLYKRTVHTRTST